jgi:metal-responsive CopG/Arc/MetJ family transcriptional regulator
MANAVKKTISLPAKLAREVERQARDEGRTVSAVVQDALRSARMARLKAEYHEAQNYWSAIAKERGIFTEAQLERYLRR